MSDKTDTVDEELVEAPIKLMNRKKDPECHHGFWIKRCSICKMILESDRQTNGHSGVSTRAEFSEFSKLVVKFKIAKKLSELDLVKKTKFYWVMMPDNIISLRSESHAHTEEFINVPAPTSAELCQRLRKFPKSMISSTDWEKIGKNSHKPNFLAKKILNLNKKIQKAESKDAE